MTPGRLYRCDSCIILVLSARPMAPDVLNAHEEDAWILAFELGRWQLKQWCVFHRRWSEV